MRTWIIAAVSVLLVIAAVSGYYLLQPNPHVGDRTKLQVTFTADERHLIDTVHISRAQLEAAGCTDGQECWVAVDGVVYDMSGFPSWMKRGRHHGVQAGTDATDAFVRSGHARDKLQAMPVVGRLQG